MGLEDTKRYRCKQLEMKTIPGYKDYMVTRNGDIFSKKLYRFLIPYLKKDGYLSVGISINSKKKTVLVHRLVALGFHENPDNKKFVNHKNGIKADNHYKNLEWCTSKENINHS